MGLKTSDTQLVDADKQVWANPTELIMTRRKQTVSNFEFLAIAISISLMAIFGRIFGRSLRTMFRPKLGRKKARIQP